MVPVNSSRSEFIIQLVVGERKCKSESRRSESANSVFGENLKPAGSVKEHCDMQF